MKTIRYESVGNDKNQYNRILFFDNRDGRIQVANIEPVEVMETKNNNYRCKLFEKASAYFNIDEDTRIVANSPVNSAYSAPLKIFVDITDKCQLSCKHCLNRKLNIGNEISLDVIKDIARECEHLGIFLVKLGGGEPLLHPHFQEIVKVFNDAGCLVSTSTNGLEVDAKIANVLASNNVKVSISIEGPKRVDEYIRGANHFDKAIAALDILKSVGVNVSLRVTLSAHLLNITDIEECIKLAVEKAVKIKFSYCRPSGSALKTGSMITLAEHKQYVDVIKYLNREELLNVVMLDEGMQKKQDGNLTNLLYNDRICGAANRSMHINSDMNISPCIFLGEEYVDKTKYYYGLLKSFWQEKEGTVFNQIRDVKMPSRCTKCSRLCKYECLATRLFATKSFDGDDPNCLFGLF